MDDPMKIEMKGISKSFPGIQALDEVDFSLSTGCVHAIVGENGAGKSTLMKILAGVYRKDSGTIYMNDEEVSFQHPAEAMDRGISIIEQEFSLFSELNVYQNIFIGKEPRKKTSLIDWKKVKVETDRILEYLNLKIDKNTPVRKLSTSNQQLLEIAKSVFFGAKFIIMDEPTSSLGKDEKEKLFSIIRSERDKGVGIIYISHRMEEIFDIADIVTVMRDGRRIGTYPIGEVDEEQLIKLMVGRSLSNVFDRDKSDGISGDVVLEVKSLSKKGSFQDINFQVHSGEILGFSGLMGAQRTELMNCIFGLDKYDGGTIVYKGKTLKSTKASDSIKRGIGMVPEDRKRDGIVQTMTIRDNMIMASYSRISQLGWIDSGKEKGICSEQKASLDIKMRSPEQGITKLSGGNQQKVILARYLALKPELLILDEPTRGIDVGAKAEVHRIIDGIVRQGMAVILISSELPEILGACDRIIVLHEGRQTGEFSHTEASQEKILSAAIA